MIYWPAVINYHGDDELHYVASEADWQQDADLSRYRYDPSDILIDSHGCVYHLDKLEAGQVQPVATNTMITLEQFIKLVQLHAVAHQQCCIDKIVFRTIDEGMRMVQSLQ